MQNYVGLITMVQMFCKSNAIKINPINPSLEECSIYNNGELR